jgi:hypothetical protein
MANSRRIQPPEEHTRTKLLNRLGLFQTPNKDGAGTPYIVYRNGSCLKTIKNGDNLRTTIHPSLVRNHGRRKPSILGEINPTVTKLKIGEDEEETQQQQKFFGLLQQQQQNQKENNNGQQSQSSCPTCKATNKDPSLQHAVKFNEDVSVVSIPSRYQYSNRIKRVLWNSKDELAEMAERNLIEYEYEGWDYNNVVLDEEMYVDTATGSLVHPCHLMTEDGKPLYYPEQDNNGITQEEQEQQAEGEEGDDDDDDTFFRPLERQSSVATPSCQ